MYAYRDINRVGIDTNRGIITLAPGKMNLRLKETSVILNYI
ncbi:phage tail family protein [Staphylococcus aureus]|nr:phage tail family protein [Staphylococcus aureus]